MVYLSKIYTRIGDKGHTALGSGAMVSKDHPRIEAYGTVDEFNSNLGVMACHLPQGADLEFIRSVQNDLFDLGADLCVPSADGAPDNRLRIRPEQWERLEKKIDEWNEKEWLDTATLNPSFDFLKDPEEDIYTLSDGKPYYDET